MKLAGDAGWASDGAQLAPHPTVVYWTNYQPHLIENGVDIDVALVHPDGNSIPVDKLTHVTIPKLAKPTSDNPWDAE